MRSLPVAYIIIACPSRSRAEGMYVVGGGGTRPRLQS